MKALLALFIRSVRDDVRSKSTYWLRAGFVALVLLFMQGQFTVTQWVGAPGLHVFSRILWMNVFFVSIAGLSYFASVITEEKEEGTLSLLRMTDLNPLAILLGKSTGRVAGALLLLTVQLPFTILATSLGGVNLAQVLAAYATLGAHFSSFSRTSRSFFSVICQRTSLAAALTGPTLVLFFLVARLDRHGTRHFAQYGRCSTMTRPPRRWRNSSSCGGAPRHSCGWRRFCARASRVR